MAPFVLACLLTWAVLLPSDYSALAVSSKAATTFVTAAPRHAEANTDDQKALLCFKSQVSDPSEALASWSSSGNASLQLCYWHGVTCGQRHASRVVALDLANSELSGPVPPCIANLSFLRFMHLQNNSLHGPIPSELGQLRRLIYLNLSDNSLDGGIPGSLGNIPFLAFIDLARNDLTGQIPEEFMNSSSLQFLRLGQNRLGGSVPPVLSKSSTLSHVDLRQNNLSGSIPPSLGNLSSLSYLYLSDNNLVGGIPESLGGVQSIRLLALQSNRLSGTVPLSLYNISTLVFLVVGQNFLVGKLPDDIGNSLPNIQMLILGYNNFQGTIPGSLANATNLQVLDLSVNSFLGAIPSLGLLKKLTDLDFSFNHLQAREWSFLSSLSNCTQLTTLGLTSNKFKGSLPSWIGNLSSKLGTLWLSLNKISGAIPPEIGNLKGLSELQIHDNLLSGSIPSVIGTLGNLSVLSLSVNKLSGPIPDSFGNLQKLTKLYLRENELNGSIPGSLGNCKNLVLLNLSHNSLEGSIPSELLEISSLSLYLDLSHNRLTGLIPEEVGELINLGSRGENGFNISNNQLSGQIPSALGRCAVLESIRMERNLFQGSIPQSFVNLRGLKEIDLSQNNMSGEIPEFFASLSYLQYLNLSFNNFNGAVPTTGVFANASVVSVQGNKRLCTTVPILQLPLCVENSKRKNKYLAISIVIPLIVSAISLSCLTAVILKTRAKPSFHQSKANVSYGDILKATDGFSTTNLIGSGSFGTVYKGTFYFDINPVAVKVFNLNFSGASRTFAAECEALRNIRHRNLIKVISSCCTVDPTGEEFKALIFQYMPNGSLERWLHQKTLQPNAPNQKRLLSLSQRMSIALDVAFALDYLHNQCVCPLVHCDLKPQNVLLDYDMTACVSDFGLARFVCANSTSATNSSTSLAGLKGSIGYIAPEYGMGSQISTEGDVYSFGVLLLEMLTGKQPTDEAFKNGMNLHNFVNSAFPDRIGEILDPVIMQEGTEHEDRAVITMDGCIIPLIKIGLLCSMESAKDRPGMGHVSTEIQAIYTSFSNLNGW